MIVADLDGTLLAHESELPEENILALKEAMAAGVRVSIASGRMPEATLPIARQIGVNAPLSLFNGAMTYDMQAGKVLRARTIACARARELLRLLEARGTYVQAFPEKGFFYERRTQWTTYYENKINVRGSCVGDKLSSWLQTDVYKLLCVGEAEELRRVQLELADAFPDLCFVKSCELHLEVILSGVDKGAGILDLASCTGIDPKDMLAFGDEMNDLPMLKAVGTGYAMENAVEGVKRETRLIAPRNTQCGVARIVRLLLNEGRMGGREA